MLGGLRAFVRRVGCLAAGLLVCGAGAALAVPASNLITAPLVSPATAWSYYGSSTTHTPGVAAWGLNTAEQATPLPPELTAMARTLGAGGPGALRSGVTATAYAQNVLNYVRNNINVEYRFGLGKGARGALIDQSGTPFDQAELMVKLLRYAGVSATYQVGTVTLNAQQFGLWTGLVTGLNQGAQTFTVNAQAACQLLADGAIPASVNNASSCSGLTGNLTTVTLGHIWVLANGVAYDPAMKPFTLTAGIDLPSAMGCGGGGVSTCGAAVVTAAMNGATTGTLAGAPYIQNVNNTGLSSQLKTYAGALESYIKANNPGARLQDVVAGKTLPQVMPAPDATITYSTPTYSWTGDIPDAFRTTLQVEAGYYAVTFFADEIAGRRVRLLYWDSLYVDDVLLSSTTYAGPTTPGAPATAIPGNNCYLLSCTGGVAPSIVFNIQHPYAANSGTYGADHVVQLLGDSLSNGAIQMSRPPLTIVFGLGNSSQSTEKHYAELQAVDPQPVTSQMDPSDVCGGTDYNGSVMAQIQTDCRSDGQPLLGAKFLNQASMVDWTVQGMTGTTITRHHDVGVVMAEESNGKRITQSQISISSALSVNSAASSATGRATGYQTSVAARSVIEGSVLQQSEDSYGLGTMTLGTSANTTSSVRIFQVTPSTLSGLLSSNQLAQCTISGNYYNYALLQTNMGSNYSAIFTECTGSVLLYNANSVNYGLTEGLFKGGSAGVLADPTKTALDTLRQTDYASAKKQFLATSEATGGFTLTPAPDIVTGPGAFPYALPFQRTYSSQSGPNVTTSTTVVGALPSSGGAITSYSTSIASSYTGPSSDVFSRLGGGWTHNYEVTASYVNNGVEGLGQRSALDAASVIAGLWALQDAEQTQSFQDQVTGVFIKNWIGGRLTYNAVSVNLGGKVISFHRLSDNSFAPPPGKSAKLTQSGERVLDSFSNYDYSPVTLTYVGEEGDQIPFNWAIKKPSQTSSGAKPFFKALSWTFPSGVVVTFTYAIAEPGATATTGKANYTTTTSSYRLTKVSNNLGRSLSFSGTPEASLGYTAGPQDSTDAFLITKVTDENGRTATFAAVAATGSPWLPTSFTATDPNNNSTIYTYTPGSDSPDPADPIAAPYRLRRWFEPSNSTTPYLTVAYDELYRVKTVTDILGHQSQHFAGGISDEMWKQGQMISPLNEVTTTVYDYRNNLLQTTDPLGRITTNQYDIIDRKIQTTRPEGDYDVFAYDVRSNVVSTTKYPKPSVTPVLPALTSSSVYMEGASVLTCVNPVVCNKPQSETDARGNVTSYGWYSNTGELSSVTKPADANGNQPQTNLTYTAYTDANSNAGLYLLTSKTDKISPNPVNSASVSTTTTYAYNTSNKYVLSSATVDSGGLNLTTGLTFDAIGNVTAVTDPNGNISNYTWDAGRRLLYAIGALPNGATTSGVALPRLMTLHTYDADGLLIEQDLGTGTSSTASDFALQKSTTFTYDAAGNKIQTTVWNGAVAINASTGQPDPTQALGLSQTSYDADDRPQFTAVRMNPAVYNALPAANSLSTAGANGPDRITQTVYDAAGQTTQVIRAYGVAGTQQTYATYAYGLDGEKNSETDANGNLTSYAYDGFNRLSYAYFPSPSTVNTSNSNDYEAYGYDNNGNRLTLRKRDGLTLTFAYDALNRQTQKVVPAVGAAAGYTVNTQYDLMNRPLSVLYASTNTGVTYAYDNAGRMLSETNTMPAASQTLTYAYDHAGNKTSITYPDAAAFTYGYDGMNRFNWGGNAGSNPATDVGVNFDTLGRVSWVGRNHVGGTAYSYDLADRVTKVQIENNNGQLWSWSYNPAGQVVTKSSSNSAYDQRPPANDNEAHTYDGLNRDAAVTAVSGYDANQNLTTDPVGARSFTYDAENKLVAASGSGTSAAISLSYDPLGRLYQEVATSGGSSTTTQFLYSGDKLVAEYNGAGVMQVRYLHGPAEDQPLIQYGGSSVDGTTAQFLYTDRQGSVVALENTAGTVQTPFTYGPYGEPASWGGTRFAYTGQIEIPEARLYHYKARVYDPARGAFNQTDPIGYKDDLNLYGYVKDDPLDNSDPTGTECVTVKDGYHCTPPPGSPSSVGSFDVPKQKGLPQEISKREEGYHEYHAQASTDKTGEAVKSGVTQAVIDHPVPNSAGSAATAKGTDNKAGISIISSGPLSDHVRSYVTKDSNGNTVVVNVTVPGQHVLTPGYVAQYIVQTKSGTSVIVVGEGNAIIQVGPGSAMGSYVFQRRAEADIKEGVKNANQ